MANVKITDMPQATTIGGDDIIPIVQGGINKQIKKDDFLPKNYSTTEQRIGTWIDGKPIYRKVIPYTSLPSSPNTTKDFGIGYTKAQVMPLKCESILNHSTWGAYYNNFVAVSGSTVSYISVSFAVVNEGGEINVRIRSSYDLSPYTGYAIIQYTKTTD